MDIERFHNELAMRLGYERIVSDKRILISVEESDDPVVTIRVQGYKDIKFKASDGAEGVSYENQHGIKDIVDAAHQAYNEANKCLFKEIMLNNIQKV